MVVFNVDMGKVFSTLEDCGVNQMLEFFEFERFESWARPYFKEKVGDFLVPWVTTFENSKVVYSVNPELLRARTSNPNIQPACIYGGFHRIRENPRLICVFLTVYPLPQALLQALLHER